MGFVWTALLYISLNGIININLEDYAFNGKVWIAEKTVYGYPKDKPFLENKEEYQFSKDGRIEKIIYHPSDNSTKMWYSQYYYRDDFFTVSNFLEGGKLIQTEDYYMDKLQKITQVVTCNIEKQSATTNIYTFDSYGKIIQREKKSFYNHWLDVIYRKYDQNGNLVCETHVFGKNETNFIFCYEYENGLLTSKKSIYNDHTNRTIFNYDKNGLLSEETEERVIYQYDEQKRKINAQFYHNNKLYKIIQTQYDDKNNTTDIILYGNWVPQENQGNQKLDKKYHIHYDYIYY